MKPKYKLDKKQKELARQRKQERKRQEKLVRKEQGTDSPAPGGSEEVPPSE
jgi:hypothetical protein